MIPYTRSVQLQTSILPARLLEFRANFGSRFGIFTEEREALGGKDCRGTKGFRGQRVLNGWIYWISPTLCMLQAPTKYLLQALAQRVRCCHEVDRTRLLARWRGPP